MVTIPHPSECIGVVGVALATVGIVLSIALLLLGVFSPWGWGLLLASGTLWALSWLYCMNWEWERFPDVS